MDLAREAQAGPGGRFGGWSLYLKDGKPAYAYKFLGLERYTVASSEPLPAGQAKLVFDFAYDGGGVGKDGTGILSVNGREVAKGRIEHARSRIFPPMKLPTWALMRRHRWSTESGKGRIRDSTVRSAR